VSFIILIILESF